MYRIGMESKNISLTVDLPDTLFVKSDPKLLDIVLRNIIANANFHTVEGGFIRVFTAPTSMANQVVLNIENTDKNSESDKIEYMQKIFEGKEKADVGKNGLGLGIILINDFSKKINCTVRVRNKQGETTCFTLYMPQ